MKIQIEISATYSMLYVVLQLFANDIDVCLNSQQYTALTTWQYSVRYSYHVSKQINQLDSMTDKVLHLREMVSLVPIELWYRPFP